MRFISIKWEVTDFVYILDTTIDVRDPGRDGILRWVTIHWSRQLRPLYLLLLMWTGHSVFTGQYFTVFMCCLGTWSGPTLWQPHKCSLPGSSVHGISQAKILEWVALSFSGGMFQTQELNPGLLHCKWILYWRSPQGSPTWDMLSSF